MRAYVKLENLKQHLSRFDTLVLAFSGGADSTFLLKIAHSVLGDKLLAVTARSAAYPERSYNDAMAFVQKNGIPHLTIVSEELDIDGFRGNSLKRCYLYKKVLFTKINEIAREKGIVHVAEASNYDDLSNYHPGIAAMIEQGILSPLRKAELTKTDIHALSKELGLLTGSK